MSDLDRPYGLYRYIYISDACDLDASDIETILAQSRENNSHANITGILMFSQQKFLQILEGDAVEIDPLIERIRQDPRHKNMKVLVRGGIDERAFGEWAMAYVGDERDWVQEVSGLSDFEGLVNKLEHDAMFGAKLAHQCGAMIG